MVTQLSFQDESKFLQGRILGLRPTQCPYKMLTMYALAYHRYVETYSLYVPAFFGFSFQFYVVLTPCLWSG